MNHNTEEKRDEEVQGIEVIDLGDAMVETKQPTVLPWIPDSCCAYTYIGR